MGAYLVRRFLLMALTLFGMSVLIFVMLRLVPGNIADILVDAAGIADPKEKAKITHELGLDRPIIEQYGQWIGGLSRGDLGFAYVSERPAIEEIAPRIPISAKLAGMALFFAIIIGVPFGVISAVRQNTPLDYFLRVLSLSGLSLPSFWLGLLVLMASVHWFGTIPDLQQRTARLAAGGRAAGHPGGRGGLPQLGADHAAHAVVHARGHAPGLYPHGALQGRLERRR